VSQKNTNCQYCTIRTVRNGKTKICTKKWLEKHLLMQVLFCTPICTAQGMALSNSLYQNGGSFVVLTVQPLFDLCLMHNFVHNIVYQPIGLGSELAS
jgi:hypothetical protein